MPELVKKFGNEADKQELKVLSMSTVDDRKLTSPRAGKAVRLLRQGNCQGLAVLMYALNDGLSKNETDDVRLLESKARGTFAC